MLYGRYRYKAVHILFPNNISKSLQEFGIISSNKSLKFLELD